MVYILLNNIKINLSYYFVSRMFPFKECNKGTSFSYVYVIAKILNYFNIVLPNLTYKSPGQAQEFSQHTLNNMGYFLDLNRQAYYFHICKNGRKIYNFDDPLEFSDDTTKAHTDNEQPIGASHDVLEGDVDMHDATHGDAHGNTSSIMTMLQNMMLRQVERYEEDCRMRDSFKVS